MDWAVTLGRTASPMTECSLCLDPDYIHRDTFCDLQDPKCGLCYATRVKVYKTYPWAPGVIVRSVGTCKLWNICCFNFHQVQDELDNCLGKCSLRKLLENRCSLAYWKSYISTSLRKCVQYTYKLSTKTWPFCLRLINGNRFYQII